MINFMLDICTTSSGLRVMYLIKTFIFGICIVVPILLIIILMIDCIKSISSRDEDAIVLLKKKAIPKLIAAVIVFLVPTIVSLFMTILGVEKYRECFSDITLKQIKELEQLERVDKKDDDIVTPSPSISNKNTEYTNANSYTNSINGIKYVLYNQCSEPWGSKIYNSSTGTTVCQEGCPMTAASVIISAYNFNLTPESVYNNGLKNSYVTTITEQLAPGAFSCSYASDKSEDGILNELSDGDVIVMRRQKNSQNGTGNHWMALIDVNKSERKVYVGNSFDSGTSSTNRSGWFNINEIVINPQEVFVCKPSQTLIDKFN